MNTEQIDILNRWRGALFGEYPEESARFLKRKSDRFRNPVGDAVSKGLHCAAEYVFGAEDDRHDFAEFDALIRIRSVQEFSPAQAVGFVFKLRGIIQQVGISIGDEVQCRIDGLALRAIDVYARCRDEMGDIRVREMERRVFALFKRMQDKTASGGDVDSDDRSDGNDQRREITP